MELPLRWSSGLGGGGREEAGETMIPVSVYKVAHWMIKNT